MTMFELDQLVEREELNHPVTQDHVETCPPCYWAVMIEMNQADIHPTSCSWCGSAHEPHCAAEVHVHAEQHECSRWCLAHSEPYKPSKIYA